MPSLRRIRLLAVATLAFLIMILIWSSHERHLRDPDTRTVQDFYHKTVNAINKPKSPPPPPPHGQTVLDPGQARPDSESSGKDLDADGDYDSDDAQLAKEMGDRLKAAEQKAKDLANKKAPLKPDAPSEVIGVGNAAEGQGQKKEGEEKKPAETEEEHEVEQELGSILKKSPVIIFSKTYCPYSKKAKALLLQKYVIDPAPYVVELDIHPLGPKLQTMLGQKTGRRTVPNVMINGVSIGGSDDIAELDAKGELVGKVEEIGATRKVEMKLQSGLKNA